MGLPARATHGGGDRAGGLGFAAGAMAWMVFFEGVRDELEETDGTTVTVVVALSAAAMVAFQFLIR